MEDPNAIFFAEFLNSAEGLVDRLASDLEDLRGSSAPADDVLTALLRGFHSLKGNSSFVPDCPMTPLAHAAEEAVEAVRSGRLFPDSLVAPLAEATECLQMRLVEYSEVGSAAPCSDRELEAIAALKGLAEPVDGEPTGPRYHYAGEDVTDLLELLDEAEEAARAGVEGAAKDVRLAAATARLLKLAAVEGASSGLWAAASDGPGALFRWLVDRVELRRAPVFRPTAPPTPKPQLEWATPEQTGDAPSTETESPANPAGETDSAQAVRGSDSASGSTSDSASDSASADDQFLAGAGFANESPAGLASGPIEAVRGNVGLVPRRFQVDADVVDGFLDYAGELRVLADRTAHLDERLRELAVPLDVAPEWSRASDQFAADFRAFRGEFDMLAGKLQRSLLDIRQVPVKRLLARHADLIRRLARQLGKQVDPVIEGGETRADKTIIEQLEIPLTHMVRNSIDHGLENSSARVRAGKAPRGAVTLRADTQGEYFTLEVIDDGRGIDFEALRRVAVGRGLLTEREAVNLSESELLFRSGLSSREAATELSGRGVGMDVVRAAVRQMGGTVEVVSEPGRGARFAIKVRSAGLSSVPCVPVRVGTYRFFIPHEATRAWFAEEAGVAVDAPFLDLSNILPELPGFAEEFVAGNGAAAGGDRPGDASTGGFVVVLESGGEAFHLRVDEAGQKMDVVAQPLDQSLMQAPYWSMASVGGDQEIRLILDVDELANRSHAETGTPGKPAFARLFTEWRQSGMPKDVLFFEAGDRSCAVDAQLVEEILASRPITPVPGAASHIRGLVRSRSRVVPVLDTHRLLGLEWKDQDRMVVVTHVAQGAARHWVAFDVDRVTGVSALERGSVEPNLLLDLGRFLDGEGS
jgi:two-component system chemotaxis sensor kinase CheA